MLARKMDWAFLDKRFGEAYRDGPGQPPLPTRLIAGLTILKYADDLSDEALCARCGGEPLLSVLRREEVFRAQAGPGPQLADTLSR
jgi:IS5 family transposase